MEGVSLIGFLVVGLVAGWLGGKIMRGGGFGFVAQRLETFLGAGIAADIDVEAVERGGEVLDLGAGGALLGGLDALVERGADQGGEQADDDENE